MPAATASELEKFRHLALHDGTLLATLESAPDDDAFCALMAQLAQKHCFHLGPEDVRARLVAARRMWIAS